VVFPEADRIELKLAKLRKNWGVISQSFGIPNPNFWVLSGMMAKEWPGPSGPGGQIFKRG